MRALLLTALLLALILVGLHFATRAANKEVPAGPEATHDSQIEDDPRASPPPAASPEATADVASLDTALETERAVSAPAHAELPCKVFGRVLDELDQPLAEVLVRLHGYKSWADGIYVPKLSGAYDYRGWETRTDTDGRFRFETPVPTVEMTRLSIEPDPYHDSAEARLGGSDAENRAALTAGDNDLGDFRLATTGAIEGRVVDENGRPLAEVELDTGPDRAFTYSRGASTDATGSYLIPHARLGKYMVKAKLADFLTGYCESVEVGRARTTLGIDFVLRQGPTLQGRVVDEQRSPVAGAKLRGLPRSSGQGAGGTSAEDGSFTVHLPQDEAYTLSVEHPDYEPYALRSRDHYYEPGTEGIEIVLAAAAKTIFRVLDADTGSPVERFGLRVLRDNGSRSEIHTGTRLGAPPRADDHPGGEVELAARPGIDKFVLNAPGYLALAGDVEHESPGEAIQVLRIDRGASLRGRAFLDGAPLSHALVEISQGMFARQRSDGPSLVSNADAGDLERLRKEALARMREELPSEPTWQSFGEKQKTTSSDDGSFSFQTLERGHYRVELRSKSGASLVLAPVVLANQETKDLGDLALTPGATILGRVLVPSGRAPSGLTVYLDESHDRVTQTTDAAGEFRFAGLSEGPHRLVVDEVAGLLVASEPLSVTLGAGETREIMIDLRDRGTCAVSLVLEIGGVEARGLRVELVSRSDPHVLVRLGETDANGRVEAVVRAIGEAYVSALTPDRILLANRERLLALDLDARIDERVALETGSLELGLPASLVLPTNCEATLALVSLEDASLPRVATEFSWNQEGLYATSIHYQPETRRVVFEMLPVGPFELSFELRDRDSPPMEIQVDEHTTRVGRIAVYERTGVVEIRSGSASVVQLD
jgi:protocatechuate 3,4-dioxygenase beta subunit